MEQSAAIANMQRSIEALWARLNSITNAGGQIVIVSGQVAGANPLNNDNLLIGTADAANLPSGIVVGTTPGGELGGTWASPTVDATHSGSAHHALVTLSTELDTLLQLATQALDFDTQTANKVLAGPTSGGAAKPTMRALVAADLPIDASDIPTISTVSTTTNAVTTLATIAAAATTTMLIEAKVVARRTGGSAGTAEDGAGYELRATVKNVGGTATLIGSVAVLATFEDQAGWDATIDVSGGNARIRVTGATNNNIDWKASVKTLSVS